MMLQPTLSVQKKVNLELDVIHSSITNLNIYLDLLYSDVSHPVIDGLVFYDRKGVP